MSGRVLYIATLVAVKRIMYACMLSQISAIKQKIATAYYINNYYQILVIGLVIFKVHAKMILI